MENTTKDLILIKGIHALNKYQDELIPFWKINESDRSLKDKGMFIDLVYNTKTKEVIEPTFKEIKYDPKHRFVVGDKLEYRLKGDDYDDGGYVYGVLKSVEFHLVSEEIKTVFEFTKDKDFRDVVHVVRTYKTLCVFENGFSTFDIDNIKKAGETKWDYK